MPAAEPWKCPHCGAVTDISEQGFCADFSCPSCGQIAQVHTLLANFKLTSVLGYGGMSTVYRAEDMVLGRSVAIKVLSGAYQDVPERRKRFGQECSNMAKVHHENVVSVYSAGWSAGHFYIAMEVVEGDNLEVLLEKRHFFLPHEALEIIRQVAEGLKSAAAAGVLHRDIKPGNVIITPKGVSKVLDFGLAQDAQFNTEEEGIIWATPFYAPPETLLRRPEDVRSDIYALGMTLRALLTGKDRLAEDAPNEPEALVELKRRMPHFRSLYPNLDESLGDLVDHMTAFSPADRPESYDELLEEIAEVQAVVGKSGLRRLRIGEKRQWRLMVAALGGAALPGIIGAFLIASGGEVYHSYAALPVEAQPRWDEWNAYAHAHEALEKGEPEEAEARFEELADNAREPRLAEAAALHALMLAIETHSEEAPALVRQAEALRDSSSEWPDLPELLRLLPSAQRGDENRRSLMRQARDQDVCCAARLRELFPEKKEVLTVLSPWEEMRAALKRGDVEEGQQLLAGLAKVDDLSDAQRSEVIVLQELCPVMVLLFDKMHKRFGKTFRENASPEEISNLASQMAPEPFAAEVRSLVFMLHGDYKRAFETEPYADQPNSREPFAIIMRDWKKRLSALMTDQR